MTENIDAPFLPGLEPEKEKNTTNNKGNSKDDDIKIKAVLSDDPTCALCDLYGGTCPRHAKK